MPVREQVMYVASDGSLHKTRPDAEHHEQKVEFEDWCRKNICVGGEWCANDVAKAVLEVWCVKRRNAAGNGC